MVLPTSPTYVEVTTPRLRCWRARSRSVLTSLRNGVFWSFMSCTPAIHRWKGETRAWPWRQVDRLGLRIISHRARTASVTMSPHRCGLRCVVPAAPVAGSSGLSGECMRSDRQRPQPSTGRRKDGIAYRGCHRRYREFADPAGPRVIDDDVDIERGQLIHPQHTLVVEVAL